jgi:chemotaxis methyl-accepting protein methylase
MDTEKKYFIIEKAQYNFDKQPRFNIMKDRAYTLSDATKMLIAYEQLNDIEEKTYYLQEVDLILGQEKPLILTDEVRETSSEEMPF